MIIENQRLAAVSRESPRPSALDVEHQLVLNIVFCSVSSIFRG